MKGAKTEPLTKINNPPSVNIITIIGASHNFFLSLKKFHNSIKSFMIRFYN